MNTPTPTRNITGDEYGALIEAEYAADRTLSDEEYERIHGSGRFTYIVYRYWCDTLPEGKRLLYVGFTRDFGSRDGIHWCNSWWRGLVTRCDMDVYPLVTRAEARAAEARTIRSEVPLFNIHKNPYHDAVHGPQWTSANVEQNYYAELKRLLAADAQLAASAPPYAGVSAEA